MCYIRNRGLTKGGLAYRKMRFVYIFGRSESFVFIKRPEFILDEVCSLEVRKINVFKQRCTCTVNPRR